MSELDNLLRYLIAEAEHGTVKFTRLNRRLSERELNNLLSLYPFVVDDKMKLYCSPPQHPSDCYMQADVESFTCQTVTDTRVMCYSPVTGHLYSPATSRKIMDALRSAYSLCVLRLRRTNEKLGATNVPTENKPEGEPKNQFDNLIRRINQGTGIPTDQAIATPPSLPPPLREDLLRLAPCYLLAKLVTVPEFTEALNQHNLAQAYRFLPDVIIQVARLNLLTEYERTVNECAKVLKEI